MFTEPPRVVDLDEPETEPRRPRHDLIGVAGPIAVGVIVAALVVGGDGSGPNRQRTPIATAAAASQTPLACHPERNVVMGADDERIVTPTPVPVSQYLNYPCVIRSSP